MIFYKIYYGENFDKEFINGGDTIFDYVSGTSESDLFQNLVGVCYFKYSLKSFLIFDFVNLTSFYHSLQKLESDFNFNYKSLDLWLWDFLFIFSDGFSAIGLLTFFGTYNDFQ